MRGGHHLHRLLPPATAAFASTALASGLPTYTLSPFVRAALSPCARAALSPCTRAALSPVTRPTVSRITRAALILCSSAEPVGAIA